VRLLREHVVSNQFRICGKLEESMDILGPADPERKWVLTLHFREIANIS
jgi:hypothetical protein